MVNFYSHISWGQLKTALAERLGDSGNVYWADAELGLYLTEALRMWGLMTGYWRDTGVIQTSANTPFYDLTTLQNVDAESLLNYTVTDRDLVTQIQYHLLEPATGSSWTGSDQFTLADLTKALQKRRDQLLADTGCVVTRTTGIATLPPQSRIFFDDDVVAIRRLAFVDADGVVTPLLPSDILAQRNYSSAELYTPGDPYSYSSASARPTEIILVPPTMNPGTLDMVSVNTGAALDPTVGVVLGLPDDYAWAVKWGAMADILSKDGPARDPVRSAYCERRYQLGVELIKLAPVVINAEINGVPLDTDSLTNMDAFNSTWQSDTGVPDSIAEIRTLVALAPCPDDVYSATFDVVRKAIIPSVDGDLVQIGREQLDTILDYAEHLAAFKMGGEEFKSTLKGAQNFFKSAVNYNERLAAGNPNALALMAQASADMEDRPYRVVGGLGALQGEPVSGGSAMIDKNNEQANPDTGQVEQ